MPDVLRTVAVGDHDRSFLILDRVGASDYIIGIRGPLGTVSSVYLMDLDIKKLVQFLSGERSIGYTNHV